MTVGEIIDILEQFPRDQIMEMGIVTKITQEDPQWITCLPIADILVSEKHPIIVDPDIHSVISLCACKCANRTLSERVPGGTQATVSP